MDLRVTILGVQIDRLTKDEALSRIRSLFTGSGQHHILTPNPEMLVESVKNDDFFRVLSASSMNLPDGVGLLLASRSMGEPIPERITGIDMLLSIAYLPEPLSLFLLGAAPGIAGRAAEKLLEHSSSVTIAGTYSGSPESEDAKEIIARINGSEASVLFVAFGSPKQDLWIHEHLSSMPKVKLAMGVGGAFDFLSGKRRRAPHLLQKLGLEWLFRLLLEPRRILRIFRATVVFPLLVLRYGKSRPVHASVQA